MSRKTKKVNTIDPDVDYYEYPPDAPLPTVKQINALELIGATPKVAVARMLLGGSATATFWVMMGSIVYGIPFLLFIAFFSKFISKLIQKVIYKFIEPTKKNRWAVNSWLHVFWFMPFTICIPSIILFIATLILVLPAAIVGIFVFNVHHMEDVNLFFIVYGFLSSTSDMPSTFGSLIFNLVIWDSSRIILSTIKLFFTILSPMIMYFAHDQVVKNDFINSNNDVALMYE